MDRSSLFYLLITSFLLLQWLIAYSSANSDINTDRSSLTSFKSRISFDPHNILSKNWSSGSSICSWIGVTCDSRYRRVTRLNVSSMGLVGTFPPEIGNLSFLVSLDLNHNSFHGSIPLTIFNMSFLEYLNLNYNNLSGRLPLDMCKHNRGRLAFLRISYNKLHGEIPSCLDQWSQLVCFTLYGNSLNGFVPREIGNLTKLQRLSLGENKLTGDIPASICKLRSLQILYLAENNLEGALPSCMGNFSTSLVVLHLNANNFTGFIPSTFTKGCSLQSINLNGNKLEGTLPHTLVNCQALLGIDIGNNEIRDAFPFWMEILPQLRILVLRSNKFNGTMLAENSNTERPFPKLQVLDVSHNAFVGFLPDRYFKNFRSMIDARENQTRDGEILFQRYMVLKLTLKGLDQLLYRLLDTFATIDLSSNRFNGSIPPSIGSLNSLRYLNLSHNTIGGHIPSSVAGMSLLESLDLSSNKLDGKIPNGLSSLTFLEKLNLLMNNLEGQIPQSTQLSTFGNESYVENAGLCGFPLTKECGRGDGKPSPPYVEVELSDRDIEWDYVFAAAGYVLSLGIFSWLLLFCPRFRYKYFEKVEDVLEKIFECCRHCKKRERRRRVARNQVKRQQM